MTPPRFCPHRDFPSYAYVPGLWPHPIREPDGHSFRQHVAPLPPSCMSEPKTCESWLFGFDLFHHGYYWEAHESWEAVWQALGRTTNEAQLVKALIKFAAAGVKAREGNIDGVRKHLQRCAELATSDFAIEHPRHFGVDWRQVHHLALQMGFEASELCAIGKTGDRVTIVFGATLPVSVE